MTLSSLICMAVLAPGFQNTQANPPSNIGVTSIKKVASLPLALQGGTDTAVSTTRENYKQLFEKVNCEMISEVRVKATWEDTMGNRSWKSNVGDKESLPQLPSPKELLQLGKALGADFVAAGTLKWHTKSVWVNLGPKTKAEATVNMLIIDVAKEEVALEAENVVADSTKKEKGYETAASLLVSAGFTALSGGPKTPHQQRSGVVAIGKAMEPWLQSRVNRKIR